MDSKAFNSLVLLSFIDLKVEFWNLEANAFAESVIQSEPF